MSGRDEHHSLDAAEYEAQCRTGIERWIAEHLGGTVVEIERLERWRPQWKVTYSSTADSPSATRAVLVRGNRPIAPVRDLRFEMEVMQVLEANGILVPHIHGWMESPAAFVMDWVETDADRAPGMLHTAIADPTSMTEERWQATLGYMEHLAQMHAVPVEEFSSIPRLGDPPSTPTEIALRATEQMYDLGAMAGNIDVTLEFLQRWLRRNVPGHRTEVSFIAGDAGQFMSRGSEVTALLDFEIANLGDTHWDLACFRGRHPYENMGDIPALYRRYEEVTGTPVDLPVVCYHTVAFLQLAVIGATFFMLPEVRGANWVEGALEHASITRRALEAAAEFEGVTLDHDLCLPEPAPPTLETSGLQKLVADIGRLPTSTAFETWERELLGTIPALLLNLARHRAWFERESVADIADLGGGVHEDLVDADVALRRMIEDEVVPSGDLIRVLHRRALRMSMVLAGTDPDETNPFFYVLEPILDR